MVGVQLGVCALFMAAELGDVATVEVLLGFNPDLAVLEVNGATVLHAAASSGHVGIMKALLDRGVSPAVTDRLGDTPLHWIPGSGSAASVRVLLERGADLNAQNSVRLVIVIIYRVYFTCCCPNCGCRRSFPSLFVLTPSPINMTCSS